MTMSDDGPTTCEDTTWLVSSAQDRELSDEEQSRLQKHIDGCDRCQVARRQFETLFRGVHAYVGRGTKEAPSS